MIPFHCQPLHTIWMVWKIFLILFRIAVHVNVSLRKSNGLSTFCTFREITTNKQMRVVGKLNYVVTAHPCVKHTCNKNVKFWFC